MFCSLKHEGLPRYADDGAEAQLDEVKLLKTPEAFGSGLLERV